MSEVKTSAVAETLVVSVDSAAYEYAAKGNWEANGRAVCAGISNTN